MNSALPLHYAVNNQDTVGLEQLIKTGISLEKVDHRGCTALMLAIEKHNVEAAKLLIKQGAKVNAKNAEQLMLLL